MADKKLRKDSVFIVGLQYMDQTYIGEPVVILMQWYQMLSPNFPLSGVFRVPGMASAHVPPDAAPPVWVASAPLRYTIRAVRNGRILS